MSIDEILRDSVLSLGAVPIQSGTQTDEQTETVEKTSLARPWNVVVHDDPITLMNYVVQVFMQVLGHSKSKAESLMLEVHQSGSSVVWTGGLETAEFYVQKLQGRYLTATLEETGG